MTYLTITKYTDGEVAVEKKKTQKAAIRLAREEAKWELTAESKVVDLNANIVFSVQGDWT